MSLLFDIVKWLWETFGWFVAVIAVVVAAAGWLTWRSLRWWRYRRGAASAALRTPRLISAGRHNHEWVIVDLSRREGSICFWANVPQAGAGIRAGPHHRYVFAHSAGYACAQGRGAPYNHFALLHHCRQPGNASPQPDAPCDTWNWVTSREHHGDHWMVSVPDDVEPGWHHFGCVWRVPADAGTPLAELYVDGQVRGTPRPEKAAVVRDSYPDVQGPSPLVLGTWTNLREDYYADMDIGWFAYFDTALGEAVIRRLWKLGPPTS